MPYCWIRLLAGKVGERRPQYEHRRIKSAHGAGDCTGFEFKFENILPVVSGTSESSKCAPTYLMHTL